MKLIRTKTKSQDAQANGFVASYEDGAETKMGIMHAVYGRAI
jgi:hypothetical protein